MKPMLVADLFKREVPGVWEPGCKVKHSDGQTGTAYVCPFDQYVYVIVRPNMMFATRNQDASGSIGQWESCGWHPVGNTVTLTDSEVDVCSGTILLSPASYRPFILLADQWCVKDAITNDALHGDVRFNASHLRTVMNWTVLRLVTPAGITIPDPDALLEALS